MSVKPFAPAWLERVVRRCLAKDPNDRYQSIRDLVLDLRTPPQESAAGPPRPALWHWAVATVGLLAGAPSLLYAVKRRPDKKVIVMNGDIECRFALFRGGQRGQEPDDQKEQEP